MVPLGFPSARPMAQALRLPFEYLIYIILYNYIIIYNYNNNYNNYIIITFPVFFGGRGVNFSRIWKILRVSGKDFVVEC